jgi:hypothetical protein
MSKMRKAETVSAPRSGGDAPTTNVTRNRLVGLGDLGTRG